MKKMVIKITFQEELLGSASADPEIHSRFIASKAPDAPKMEEEVEALGVEEIERREMTVFPRGKHGDPFLWDYQVKGFFKDACGFLRRVPGTEASKLKAYKKILDGLLFVGPRKIPLQLSGPLGVCQRPLRAQTMQGERVALATSETAPAGTWILVELTMLDDGLEKFVLEALDYGALLGIGQWRNSGKGRFIWEKA